MLKNFLNKVVNTDALDGLESLSGNSCDLAITSPLYKEKDGYNIYKIVKTLSEIK